MSKRNATMMSDKEYKKWLETAWSDPTVVAEKRKDGFINYKINVCKSWGQMTLDDVSKLKMWAMDGLPVRLGELGVAPRVSRLSLAHFVARNLDSSNVLDASTWILSAIAPKNVKWEPGLCTRPSVLQGRLMLLLT